MSKKVSQAEYLETAKAMASVIAKQAVKLSEIHKFIQNAPDFSPETLKSIREAMSQAAEVNSACKTLERLTLQRGNAFYDEAKERLNNGTLKIVRREEIDTAAE